MSEEHTPIPWRIAPKSLGGAEQIYTPKHGRIATVTNTYPDDEAKANAGFIVRACNSHDTLLAALTNIKAVCELTDQDGLDRNGHIRRIAKAAIAEAKKGE